MSLESWKTTFEVGGVILLFLTFVFGAGALITSKRINALQASQLKDFNKRLTDAKTDLGKQEERAARAETDASEAKKSASDALAKQQEVEVDLNKQKERAAIAEKTLLELKQTLADRSLTDAQIKVIADKLKPFAGQEYDVTAYWDSKESVAISERIHQALQMAGWKFLPMTAWRAMLGGVVGAQVWVHPEADEPTKDAAKSLISNLLQAGIQTEAREQNPINNPKHNRISLNVGSKR